MGIPVKFTAHCFCSHQLLSILELQRQSKEFGKGIWTTVRFIYFASEPGLPLPLELVLAEQSYLLVQFLREPFSFFHTNAPLCHSHCFPNGPYDFCLEVGGQLSVFSDIHKISQVKCSVDFSIWYLILCDLHLYFSNSLKYFQSLHPYFTG